VVAQSAVQGLKLEPSFQLHLEGVHKQ
jgi:hypothetical protein